MFSHGFGGIPSSYTALLEDLASHGYAVLSIVHPYEATAATLADGQVVPLFDEAGKPRPAFSDVIAEWSREDETMAAVTRAPNEAEQLRLLRGYLSGLHGTQATLERWAADTKLVLDRLAALPRTSAPAVWRPARPGRWACSVTRGRCVAGEFCLADRRCRPADLDGIPSGTMIDRRWRGRS